MCGVGFWGRFGIQNFVLTYIVLTYIGSPCCRHFPRSWCFKIDTGAHWVELQYCLVEQVGIVIASQSLQSQHNSPNKESKLALLQN
jgi:hypothetical protein